MLTRRTRGRCALGVGGSYGQGDYWLGQLDPASRKSHSANADFEPRVLKSWKECFDEWEREQKLAMSFAVWREQ